MTIKKFVWIGGVHGVGKSTLTQALARETYAAYMSSGIAFPYAYRKLGSPFGGFFQAIENPEFLDKLEYNILEEIEKTFSHHDMIIFDGHYSIKAKNRFVSGFQEKNIVNFLEKNNFVTPILYLLNVTPEDIFIRINTDPRDRNKEYVSRKINKIQEHYYQEKQTFYNFISFINSITPVFHREINFGEGELETHVREILEDLCQRRIA